MAILLQKFDKETGEASPLGDGTLGGAEFTIKYYDGQYSSVTGLTPLKTWVFKTDAQGRIRFDRNINDYYLSGDGRLGMNWNKSFLLQKK